MRLLQDMRYLALTTLAIGSAFLMLGFAGLAIVGIVSGLIADQSQPIVAGVVCAPISLAFCLICALSARSAERCL